MAAAVVGRPGGDRHEQAEGGRQHGIQRAPGLHRAQQLLRRERTTVGPGSALKRNDRQGEPGDRAEHDD